ncbi:restriction endonuclease subunit S [Vibrio parahaemolyticus]|uniref:restriction endonuclease subunit S n=1 Tax=Vibrio parahaemolyticus TaxID=670 RepID=UPI00146F20D5|nr:restriction endonuclease subunit S [Vibrio parahaemolyticus]MCI9697934.1 restriction endonuclease subunit S [Vibrio parahaemolyticus]MDF5452520.1 restriction endonuclease subunit S [Vibrio parahaemolyticus]NMS06849.1 restriction endonuclease subunit S [Vibrio parahaemolyticus]
MSNVKSQFPSLRFDGFAGNWQETSFGQITQISSASRVHKHEWKKSGVPFFRTSDVVAHFKSAENEKAYISYELYTSLSRKSGRVKKGDLLVTGGGSVGIPYLITSNTPLYFKDADLLWIKNKNNSGYFLYTYFMSPMFRGYLDGISHIGTISHYTISQANSTPITIPTTLDEQTKIGDFFQNLDQQIKLHQDKHNKLQQLKQAMLGKMFPKFGAKVPQVRFDGFSGNWVSKTLGIDVATVIGGGTPNTMDNRYWNGDIDWYSPTEIGFSPFAYSSVKKITRLGLKNSSAKILPKDKTILFTSRAGIGDMAILKNEATTNQGFQSLVLNEGYDTYFIYSMGHLIKDYALQNASGSTFLEISGKTLGKMKVKIPSLTEQTKIGQYFQNLDNLIALQQQKINKLKNIKQACLGKMFV